MSKLFLNPYLTFEKNTREAMEFYHQVLGGKLDLQTMGEAMPDTPAEQKDLIMHARLESDDAILMASDGRPDQAPQPGDNVSLALGGSDTERLTKVFGDLADGGTVTMALAEQVWGDTFGMCTDKFGMHWMVNITKE
jgi:PhnB protein